MRGRDGGVPKGWKRTILGMGLTRSMQPLIVDARNWRSCWDLEIPTMRQLFACRNWFRQIRHFEFVKGNICGLGSADAQMEEAENRVVARLLRTETETVGEAA